MEISRKTDYAIRLLAELVKSGDTIVSVRCAAENSDVPYSFARSIQHDLVQAGIVSSVRGSHGGMKLSVDARKITLRNIIESIQGPTCFDTCDTKETNKEGRPLVSNYAFDAVWCEADRILKDYFSAVTLYQLVIEQRYPRLRHGHDFAALTQDEYAAIAEGA